VPAGNKRTEYESDIYFSYGPDAYFSSVALGVEAKADSGPIIERSEVNSEIGYEIRVPQGWSDLNPMLVGLYNAQAEIFASEDTLPTVLSMGFSKNQRRPHSSRAGPAFFPRGRRRQTGRNSGLQQIILERSQRHGRQIPIGPANRPGHERDFPRS
jgi:hypothetical protein